MFYLIIELKRKNFPTIYYYTNLTTDFCVYHTYEREKHNIQRIELTMTLYREEGKNRGLKDQSGCSRLDPATFNDSGFM